MEVLLMLVDPLGLEPRLFWTKTRRVASYTMGQWARKDILIDIKKVQIWTWKIVSAQPQDYKFLISATLTTQANEAIQTD